MKTFAAKEKQSTPAVRKSHPYVHHPMGPVQQAQQAEIYRILRSTGTQAKLTIGQPNDKYEQEADRVADQVMAMPDPKPQRQPEAEEEEEETLQTKPLADQITPLVQRQEEPPDEEEEPVQAKFKDGEMLHRMCSGCEEETAQRQPTEEEEEELQAKFADEHVQRQQDEEEDHVQAKETSGRAPQVSSGIESRINNMKGGGQPLDPATSAFFEPRFGHNFSHVRVHSDSAAADTAKSINARAFTLGNHVVMGSGEYQPNSQSGKRLLGHELTHVKQQRPSNTGTIMRKPGDEEGKPPPIPKPPNLLTIDILNPKNSKIRIGGWSLPSWQDILDARKKLNKLFGRSPLAPSGIPMPKLKIGDDDITRMNCRLLPALCPPRVSPFPQKFKLTLPSTTLTRPTLGRPHHVAHDTRIIDHFIYAKHGAPDRHRILLDRTATEMIDTPALETDIVGHTDSHGRPSRNQKLSERRARAIEKYLYQRQVAQHQVVKVHGLGSSSPREPNDQRDWLAAARNRRVELDMRRWVWNLLVPQLSLNMPTLGSLLVTDIRTKVIPAHRNMYQQLTNFMVQARTGIQRLVASSPATITYKIQDNENIRDLQALLSNLIADLQAQRYVVRFDLPAGSVQGSYDVYQDVIHLPPITNPRQTAAVAVNLIHEYAHIIQDRTAEELLRASRYPREHTRKDELRQETEARRHEVYFAHLMQALRRGQIRRLSTYILLGQFEKERTGSPSEQKKARRGIRQTIKSHYTRQLRTNAPSRSFLIEIRSEHAYLIRFRGRETELGKIPSVLITQQNLEALLEQRIKLSPVHRSLFRRVDGRVPVVLQFLIYEGRRKLGEFGIRPE